MVVKESNTTDGRVEVASFSVLPGVSSMMTIALILVCYCVGVGCVGDP